MAAETSETLMEREFYEDCAGCRVDLWKKRQNEMPLREFLLVWFVTLGSALPISLLFPFVYFMARDLNIADREEDIGYYAGFIGSSYMFGRTVTSFFWGIVADKYGRKPVIVFSICSVMIFNTLFGLSVNFWMAVLTRFLLGSLNGLLGPIKAYAVEISPPDYQAFALSLINTSWGIGLVIGPAIGGYFAQPAEKFPKLFSKDSIFGRFPYFLPCLGVSVFAIGVLVASLWLPETLHTHNEARENIPYNPLEASENGSALNGRNMKEDRTKGSPEKSLLKNWPLMSSLIIYCVFNFHNMAYIEIFSFWSESDKRFGGLGFSTQDTGQVLAISGFGILLFQLSLFGPTIRLLGPVVSSRIAGVLTIFLLSVYPFCANLSGVSLLLVVNVASLLKNILSMIPDTSMSILQNNAVESYQRGAANGISMTFMSLFKTVAPAAAGTLFSWAQTRQSAAFLPGDQVVFFALIVVELLAVLLTFKPFLILSTLPSSVSATDSYR